MSDIQMDVFVLARDANGAPSLLHQTVAVSAAGYDDGEHYRLAEKAVEDDGYEPIGSFDRNDPAGRQMAALAQAQSARLCAWEAYDGAEERADAFHAQQLRDRLDQAETIEVGEPRIVGTFFRQAWDADDRLIDLNSEDFDATEEILGMSLEDIQNLKDNHVDTDDIGARHVTHNGPFTVRITDNIATFFEAGTLADITQDMLDAKREAYGIQAQESPKP